LEQGEPAELRPVPAVQQGVKAVNNASTGKVELPPGHWKWANYLQPDKPAEKKKTPSATVAKFNGAVSVFCGIKQNYETEIKFRRGDGDMDSFLEKSKKQKPNQLVWKMDSETLYFINKDMEIFEMEFKKVM
jgi:hypothetical protein